MGDCKESSSLKNATRMSVHVGEQLDGVALGRLGEQNRNLLIGPWGRS